MENCNLFFELINKINALEKRLAEMEAKKPETDLTAFIESEEFSRVVQSLAAEQIEDTIDDKIEDAIENLDLVDQHDLRDLERRMEKVEEQMEDDKENITEKVIEAICEKLK
jgi:polyhydroxyalkanoate synthesis regulator phasin